ncbi:MAG: PEP/pyruvate-binding domain-containing protein, partial [Burkholderiaceae bacterium]
AEMKDNPRGPFSGVKWYCKDGSVFPPKEYACAKRGGGVQHGELSERARKLRAEGYRVATLLAGIDAPKAVAAPDFADAYAQLLVEKFLVAVDDGWIMRRALFYRGALQEEDEREGARKLLQAMVMRPDWTGYRFVALRTGVRMLPHGQDTASAQRVRQMAAALSDRDAAFGPLRAKIHGTPDASDAARVRGYAGDAKSPELRRSAEELAAEIDRVYQPKPLEQTLESAAAAFGREPALQKMLRDAAAAHQRDADVVSRYRLTAGLLASLRRSLPAIKAAPDRLRALDLSIAVEEENLRLGTTIRAAVDKAPRGGDVILLRAAAEAAYGTGLLNAREHAGLQKPFDALSAPEVTLRAYMAELRYLGLVPGWGTQQLRFQFGEAMDKLAEIEPKAELFIQDQLRGSPLLFYAQVLDFLNRDANRLAGVRSTVFGREVGVGFNALNPGIARGVLQSSPDMQRAANFRADGIYVLPETVADLPPIAGIMTAGAGNPLSHVQLLARNLGIPNVAVDQSLLPDLRKVDGRPAVLAVSAGGLVEIADDGPQWDAVFGKAQQPTAAIMFEPDLKKLDLSVRGFVSLDTLRANDSGRIVGPKAAKLGELKSHFPDRVAPGVGLPFGLYRATVLDRPYRNTGKTVYQWMVESFRKLETLPAGSREAQQFAEQLRTEIYSTIIKTDPGPQFREQLRAAMAKEFGPNFRGGVFIRSDTNVEDLPGFTGAGLNLTLFNIVGFENIVKGILEVWASPYTQRAWAWRQAHMKGPEHIYPAVLLLRTVPSDVSGVMITQDVDGGDRNVLSVAVNEGVGGAVEGQAAESVRIDRRTGNVRLMAAATAPRRMVPLATGGVGKVATSGAETLLKAEDVRQLIAFSDEITKRFQQFDDRGQPAAADVEFAFVEGRLELLQIRPFNESRQAQASAHLAKMDQALEKNLDRMVNLREAAK